MLASTARGAAARRGGAAALAGAQRRRFGYNIAKKMMPPMSDTEKAALESGGVSFERNIFTGSPRLSDLDKYTAKAQLTTEEQAFVDNETQVLCSMIFDNEIVDNRDLPKEVWDYMRHHGFFALKLSKKWGGKGFSSFAVSQILQIISSRSPNAGATVAVPNSLGPGELLMAYGTKEQKERFLPKLCDGTLIPCFALTAPHSGSDAASMKEADGYVFKDSDGSLAIRASFKKRYITLAPVAGIVGLAFQLHDPEGLLGGEGKEGITIALLERSHPGLRIGQRHDPTGNAFFNGPVEGTDVVIKMSDLLGGQARAGEGWNFLMEQLSEGRGISLPAAATGGCRIGIAGVCAYSRIRKQFRVPIAEMGGVQEHLASIASNGIICVAGAELVAAIVDCHESPSVLSAVMKYEATNRSRLVVLDCQDVMAGAAISRGPKNLIEGMYRMVPIGITVEGANILTRTLMIFGQGVVRGHPHIFDVMKTLQAGNLPGEFRTEVMRVVRHLCSTTGQAISRAVTRPRMLPRKGLTKKAKYYEAQLMRLSAQYASLSDLALSLGGALKREEMISGRMADGLSTIYLGFSVLWFCTRKKADVENIEVLMDLAMQQLLHEAAAAMDGVARNFPIRVVGAAMHVVNCRALKAYPPPSDRVKQKVAGLVSRDTPLHRLFHESCYFGGPDEQLTMLRDWLRPATEAEAVLREAKKKKRELTADEEDLVAEVEAATDRIVQVDVFDEISMTRVPKGHVRPALQPYTPRGGKAASAPAGKPASAPKAQEVEVEVEAPASRAAAA